MKWSSKEFGFRTRAIHAGQPADPQTGAVMVPISLATTYVQDSPGKNKGYDYGRTINPTRSAYEECVANLEGADFGYAFASGCAATTTLLHLLKSGDHVICTDDAYGGTYRLFEQVIKNNGVTFSYVDMTNLSSVEDALQPNTRMLWVETPTNPLLKIVDIKAISGLAKGKGILVVVDNTFVSPYFQKPIEWGADIAYHSTTKFINGHSDVVGGAVALNDAEVAKKIQFLQKSIGAVPSPFDAYLCMRSLKTLALRMEAHQENGMAIARFLEKHPKVDQVIYPGLSSHPQHQLAKEQMSGFGGMITFLIKGGLPEARKFLENVRIFALAESLGGVESLIEHPAIMTHASMPKEVRESVGITDNLIRISVGVEDEKDLIADLDQAFQKV